MCVCVRGRRRCATRFIIIANTSSLESNRPSVRPSGNQSLFLIQRDTPTTGERRAPLSRKQSSIAHLIRRKGWPNFFIITCYFFYGEREAKNYRWVEKIGRNSVIDYLIRHKMELRVDICAWNQKNRRSCTMLIYAYTHTSRAYWLWRNNGEGRYCTHRLLGKKERKNVLCPADEEKCPPSFSFPAIQSANIGLYIIWPEDFRYTQTHRERDR